MGARVEVGVSGGGAKALAALGRSLYLLSIYPSRRALTASITSTSLCNTDQANWGLQPNGAISYHEDLHVFALMLTSRTD